MEKKQTDKTQNQIKNEESQKSKKQNICIHFFKAIGKGINCFFCFIVFCFVFIFAKIFVKCKVKGKENIKKDDEARVFLYNHYEIYGPLVMYLWFPLKKRPWIIDKMMDEKQIEQQMGLMIYNNYKRVPMWLKKIILVCIKNFIVFIMKFVGGISVSRENVRDNIKTFKTSTEVLEQGKCIYIAPEKDYCREGVGEIQSGFEHFARFYHKKTGKKISFYPIFISYVNKEMYIGEPIIFNPENDANSEKARIVDGTKTAMENLYKTYEVGSKKYLKHHEKKRKKQEKIAKKHTKNSKKSDNL